MAGVAATVNLAADASDWGTLGATGSGHGILRDGAKEPAPPSGEEAVKAAQAATVGKGGGKAAAAKHAAAEVLQSLNHHAEVVLRGGAFPSIIFPT